MNHHLTFTKPQLLMAFESHETIRRPGASRRSGRSGCPGWKVHGAAVAQGAEPSCGALRSLGDTQGFHHGDMSSMRYSFGCMIYIYIYVCRYIIGLIILGYIYISSMFLISSHCSSTLSLGQVPGPINSSVNEAMQGLAALMGELNCSRVSIGAAMTGGGSLPSNIGMWRNTKHGVAICLMMSYLSSHGYLCDIVYVNIYICLCNICIQHVLGK